MQTFKITNNNGIITLVQAESYNDAAFIFLVEVLGYDIQAKTE